MTYTLLDKPSVDIDDLVLTMFVDQTLYQEPTVRSFAKIRDDRFINEQFVREFTDFDGEMRIDTTLYITHVQEDFAYGSQPHLDVKSGIATHVISLNDDWNDDWGGHVNLYSNVSNEYKDIMKKLRVESPKQEDIKLWNDIKKKDVDFDIEYSYKMSSKQSIIFKHTEDSWHGVEKTLRDRKVLIVAYHDKNMKCRFGD